MTEHADPSQEYSQETRAEQAVASLTSPLFHHEQGRSLLDALDEAGWSYLRDMVLSHGLSGLVLDRLMDMDAPQTLIAPLTEARKEAIKHGLWLQRESHRVAGLLEAGGCHRVAPIKGAHLLPCLYEKVGVRSIHDVDLLIPQEDRERVHQLLVDAGYTYKVMPPARPVSQREGYERTYRSPEGIEFDIHTALCQKERVGLDYEGMWSRAREDERLHVWGAGLKALDPVDTLLVLAVHCAQDSYQGAFRQVVDLSWWLFHREPDLKEAASRARSGGAGTALWVALWLAKTRHGISVSESIMEALRPGWIRRSYLEWLLGRHLLSPLKMRSTPRLAQALTLFPVMDGIRRRGRFLRYYIRLRGRDVWERQRLRVPRK